MIIKFESSDGQIIEVDSEIMMVSSLVKRVLNRPNETRSENSVLKLLQIRGDILEKIVDWAKSFRNDAASMDALIPTSEVVNSEFKPWEEEFLEEIENLELVSEVWKAANFLEIEALLNLYLKRARAIKEEQENIDPN